MKYVRIALAFMVLWVNVFLTVPSVEAVGLLPRSNIECERTLANTNKKVIVDVLKGPLANESSFKTYIKEGQENIDNVLGCAIKTGRIHLYMMPYFIMNLVEFLLQIAGLIAVLFVVFGGYKYAVGGIGEDKESGKKTIMYALMGLVVALSSWIVVNLVQLALTS
ncbi:hypothetical protein KBD59_05770 [Candidatus Gracilibacteria bacterium]|nr:hypothetical protein [Candidatus Gracilibacteria bacterium]